MLTRYLPLTACCHSSLMLFPLKGRSPSPSRRVSLSGSTCPPGDSPPFGPGRIPRRQKWGCHRNLVPLNWALSPKAVILTFISESKSTSCGFGPYGRHPSGGSIGRQMRAARRYFLPHPPSCGHGPTGILHVPPETFHDQEQRVPCVNHFKQLDNVGMM